MKKKWWLALGVIVVLAIVLVLVIPALMPPTPGVTYANFSRLEKGMTRAEVDGLLGSPEPPAEVRPAFRDWNCWRSADGDVVLIGFDKNNCIESIHWNELLDERSSLEKLRDRLPWIGKEPPRVWTYRSNRCQRSPGEPARA